MTKRAVTKWWIGGTVALIPGAILIPASVALAAHLQTLTPGRVNVVPDDYARTMVSLIVLGALIVVGSVIAEFVAWIGALVNTHRLADRQWFNALLWAGIVGTVTMPLFGLGVLILGSAMLAYLVGGPDGTAVLQSQETATSAAPTIMAKRTIVRWSTWGLVPMGAGAVIALFVAHETNPGGFLHGHTWTALVLLTACAVAAVCGVVAESVSWWGAVFNTHRLADKTWFKLLLWSGIVGTVTMPLFGLGALVLAGVGIAYWVAAPDGMAVQPPQVATAAAPQVPPKTLAPTG